jgi:hypothetical protein
LTYIVGQCEEEQGVRNFKRGLEEIVSHLNFLRLLNKPIFGKDKDATFPTLPIETTKEMVDQFVKKKEDEKHVHRHMYL